MIDCNKRNGQKPPNIGWEFAEICWIGIPEHLQAMQCTKREYLDVRRKNFSKVFASAPPSVSGVAGAALPRVN